MHVFESWLRDHFGATAPVGHCLRAGHRERWLRLHSLPESKRYAEDHWFSATSGEVFAPYDGGIDLRVESPERAETLRRQFPPDWFSKRADRL